MQNYLYINIDCVIIRCNRMQNVSFKFIRCDIESI
mgnify:CR=1 FL=1